MGNFVVIFRHLESGALHSVYFDDYKSANLMYLSFIDVNSAFDEGYCVALYGLNEEATKTIIRVRRGLADEEGSTC